MTAEEIRKTKFESDDGSWECARWLQEIAAQLAELNGRKAMTTDVWEILYRSCIGSFEDGWTIRITGHEMSAIQRALRSDL